MTARGCKYSDDSFCYVCDEFFAKRAKKHCLSNCIRAAEAYLHYFRMPVGDQDKRLAPHVICDYCRRTLEAGLRSRKIKIRLRLRLREFLNFRLRLRIRLRLPTLTLTTTTTTTPTPDSRLRLRLPTMSKMFFLN